MTAVPHITYNASLLHCPGVPEGGGRRALAWRVLLGYLPVKQKLWPEVSRHRL